MLDNITATVPTVATPTLAYGTMLLNDSGGQMFEGIAFSKWMFQLAQLGTTTLTGVSVTIYGTISPFAYSTWVNGNLGQTPYPTQIAQAGPIAVPGVTNVAPYNPGVQPWEWFPIPGPSEQAGTGTIANPMTTTSPLLTTNIPLIAVRAVVTGAVTAGVARVYAFAIP